MAQRLTDLEHAALARRLIDHLGGPKRAAQHCRVGESDLSLYQNPNRPDRIMPADVISALQIVAGTALYTEAMTGEVDRAEAVEADPMHQACGLVKEAAEVLGAVERAMADGQVSARDFAECDKELADIEERIAVLRAGLRGKLLRSVG